ncbi:Major Facilitator Superfamily protein [Asanoa hainanensis]|uniref:Major Facilitator Superfamily protein n=1 Tax=Asanoa hainanensis TaxID=560556 RepID=A0A239NFZ8_9ACTN|nr:MFS transporter [Asanoa hainanensis]SNT53413.1 Major Facilitator Superfamily protein [Asanoa hainanensis]
MRLRENLVPPAGLPRAYALVSLIFGIGVGTFITGSTVFFTRVVGLQPHEIGIGLSAAAGAVLVCSLPLSSLADRFGPRRAWLFGVAGSAAGFLLWPLARGFFTFLAMIVFFELVNGVAQAGRNVYLIEAVDPETRVRTQAFARSWLNIGWSVGAGLAALALAIDTRAAYLALPLANAAVLLANLVLIARLPAGPAGRARTRTPGERHVFADRHFLAVTVLCAVLLAYGTVELQVAPLWLLTHTDAPKWWIGVLTLVNTVMATTLQVAMTRGAHTLDGAARALRLGGLAAALGCPVFYLAGATSGVVTMVVFVVAAVLFTLSEMWQSAGSWTLAAELPPPGRRGEYFGAFRMGNSAIEMVAPASLIALAVTTGGWGWLLIGGVFLAAGLSAVPLVRWAGRHRAAAPAEPEPALT